MARLTGDAFLFGPLGASSPPPEGPTCHAIEAALRKACRSDRIKFAHLRHSFATYLLATLLLPQDVAEPAIPESLVDVVSPRRFHRVVDRLLGKGRLGGGAVHAVSQLMGHTGPGTTLRSYCHLLDLCLGLYVSRPSSLAPVRADWLEQRLGVTSEARRKAVNRVEPVTGPTVPRLGRPTRSALVRYTPDIGRKIADARLIEAGASRASRQVRRAQAAKIEVLASEPFVWPTKEIDPPKRVRNRSRPREPYIVPWTVMAKVLNGAGDDLVETKQVDGWRLNAAGMGAEIALSAKGNGPAPLAVTAPADRSIALLLDRWLSLPRRLHRPEQTALRAVIGSLRRDAGHVRLKRLADARAFVGLLSTMGFADEEVRLSVTKQMMSQQSSPQLHAFLRGTDANHPLATRRGWTGSLVVRIRPAKIEGPRRGWQAARFALMMLAIDSGREG